jgi:hypothetical protein
MYTKYLFGDYDAFECVYFMFSSFFVVKPPQHLNQKWKGGYKQGGLNPAL